MPNAYTIIRDEKLCHTSDNWDPNIDGDKVRINMSIFEPIGEAPERLHCVSVRGDGNLGMEFLSKKRNLIKKLYRKIVKMEDVTRQSLKELGLYRA